jgi:hypothetical protein
LDLSHPSLKRTFLDNDLISRFETFVLESNEAVRLNSVPDIRNDCRLYGDWKLAGAYHTKDAMRVAHCLKAFEGTESGKEITRE